MPIALNDLETAVWIYDIDRFCIIWANQAALKLWNSSSVESLTQRDLKTGLSPAVRDSLIQYQQAFKQNQVFQENWFFTPKGKDVEAFCQFSGFLLEDDRMAMLVEATTANIQSTDALFSSTIIISNYSVNGEFISGNPPFIKELGNQVTHLNELLVDSIVLKRLYQNLEQGKRFEEDVLMNTAQGEIWYLLSAEKSPMIENNSTILLHLYNINERKTTEQRLRKQALTDPLTGLLNRRGLTHSLIQSERAKIPFTVLYIDLDGFKMVNDLLGHAIGDIILKEVAKRLRKNSLPQSTLCRFGGDEFVLVLY